MKGYLLDIDGTTLLGSQALPGAQSFVAWLRAEGLPHLWLTNNTSMSRAGWLRRLEAAGLAPQPHEIYTAGDATIDHLVALDPAPRVYLVGTEDLRRDFDAAGIALIPDADGADADTVVLGYDTELTYAKIRRAALLLQGGAAFYATHPDLTCPSPEGALPDVGAFLAMFAAVGAPPPRIIGKPQPSMAMGALRRLGVEPSAACMVGDRLATDIRMAKDAGLTSCLVLTGVTSMEALADPLPDGFRHPDHVFASLAEVHAWAVRGHA